MMWFIPFLLIWSIAWVMSWLVWIGGWIVIVPALIYFAKYSQLQAQGTSLGILVLPVVLWAFMTYYKRWYVDLKIVWIMAFAFIIGWFLWSYFAVSLPENTIKKIFSVLLIIIGVYMLFSNK